MMWVIKLLTNICILIFLGGCSDRVSELDKEVLPEQVIQKFACYQTFKGKKCWYLQADRAILNENNNLVHLDNFKLNFYNQKTESVSTLEAGKGELKVNTFDLFIIGKAIITTEAGTEILESSNLRYISTKKKIVGNDFVRLSRKDAIITGKGIESTPDLSSFIIKENKVILKR